MPLPFIDGLVRRGGGHPGFAATPLSPGVPLDGTETVTGLRQLARAAELDRVGGLLDEAGRHGFAPGRRYARYKGPYLESLRKPDLLRPARPWRAFFGLPDHLPRLATSGGGKAVGGGSVPPAPPPPPPPPPPAPPSPWSLPESMDAMRERAEENIVFFLPNYVRAAAVIVAVYALLTRPLALLGLALIAGVGWASLSGRLPPSMRAPPPPPTRPGGGPAPPPPPARAALNLAIYILAAYTRAPGAALRGGSLAVAAAAVHAALLAAPGERAAASRAGRAPGVRLRSVLTGRPAPGVDSTPDPRRALRELGSGLAALARAALAGGRLAAGEAADRATAWARAVLGVGAPPVVGARRTRAGVAPRRSVQ